MRSRQVRRSRAAVACLECGRRWLWWWLLWAHHQYTRLRLGPLPLLPGQRRSWLGGRWRTFCPRCLHDL